jgi:hypothetical protein
MARHDAGSPIEHNVRELQSSCQRDTHVPAGALPEPRGHDSDMGAMTTEIRARSRCSRSTHGNAHEEFEQASTL